jgi:hypothetical protein
VPWRELDPDPAAAPAANVIVNKVNIGVGRPDVAQEAVNLLSEWLKFFGSARTS